MVDADEEGPGPQSFEPILKDLVLSDLESSLDVEKIQISEQQSSQLKTGNRHEQQYESSREGDGK